MRRRAIVCRLGLAAAIAAPLAVAGTTIAGSAAGGPVGPHQYFTASVNGSNGAAHPVVIRMACFGAIRPGQTGHPFAGQTVGVSRLPVPSPAAATTIGYTGDRATSIGAFFGPPPPAGAPVPPSAGYVDFTAYGTQAIPTSLLLPCGGSGQVTFVPLPLDPSERSVAVPVEFVGQP